MSDPKFLQDNAPKLAKLAMEPETDWHEEAQMYANVVGKVKAFCERLHVASGQYSCFECLCLECETKRRIARIIADNLK